MREFVVATIPIESGQPVWGPVAQRAEIEVARTGPRTFVARATFEDAPRRRQRLCGYYLGRLAEGEFGTTGRPAVIICTGTEGALAYLEQLAAADPNYLYRTLDAVWRSAAQRQRLLDFGTLPTIAGQYLDTAITIRPILPHVPCGHSPDVFGPTEAAP